jgi:hypothetical protein
MSRKIFKYSLAGFSAVDGRVNLKLPLASDLLHVGYDPGGNLSAWFIVNETAVQVTRRLQCFGTGFSVPHDINAVPDYVASVNDGPFIWHWFDLGDDLHSVIHMNDAPEEFSDEVGLANMREAPVGRAARESDNEETCPECGSKVQCYDCASRGGWQGPPMPEQSPYNDEPPEAA